MRPKVLEPRILNQYPRILLEEDDGHTNDIVDDDDGDDDDDGHDDGDDDNDNDNGDNDPVELFQKQGKWWELIVTLLGQ